MFAVCLAAGGASAAGPYPPLAVEIAPDHPLFIFDTADLDPADPSAYGDGVIRAWGRLPDALKPFAAMLVAMPGNDAEGRHLRYRALLQVLREAEIPTVLRLADADLAQIYDLAKTEELLRDFTFVKGIQAADLPFEEYHPGGPPGAQATPAVVEWLVGAIDVAARYGRFIAIELDEIRWPRAMANVSAKPLYDKLVECRGYVVPVAAFRGPHTIAQQSAAMGLWLEGAAAQWGVAPTSEWYRQAGFLEPGVFGRGGAPGAMPSDLYSAMILCGAMTGASVYSFAPGSDLWFGERRHHWDSAIEPTLRRIVSYGLIARDDFVAKKAQVAYQLVPAQSPQEFHLNLRDIDGVLDQGLLIRGAYGMERPGQVPELIPNSGRHYWVPILSPYAPQAAIEQFARVVRPGAMTSAEAWTELLDRYYRPDGLGSAFICRIGRGLFVLHTRENLYETQTYRIPSAPAPVLGLKALRNEEGVELTWPFREGDVAYRVHRRVLPDGAFEVVASDVDTRSWIDHEVTPELSVAYSVTALTNETALREGQVNYGDSLAFSVVESEIEEEVVITPLLGYGKGRPLEQAEDPRPASQEWWPGLEGLTEDQRPVAEAVAQRIEAWDKAFSSEDLDGVMDLYATDYQDLQGWRFQYARRAYQWFFERYGVCKMDRQIRAWDFSQLAGSQQVSALLYCRFRGVALTDPSGLMADPQAYFPRTDTGEIMITFVEREGAWRILRTDPALPNFKDILSFSAGPYDAFAPGPDLYVR
ncbi:MAG: hypothetical protein JXR94_14780 [Candidatus Hydrogenedentes bacterium]|nr:hypothetical protein [Candidatus Hydrogenedentota bacterium]